jgi:two-component system CheB/CheR fusion protein
MPRKRSSVKKPACRPEASPGDDTALGARGSFPIVGMGASAGGLEAVSRLLGALPGDTGMAFVLVQHLDPTHQSQLTEILSRATSMPVLEVTDGLRMEPDRVYVIPPGATMVVRGPVLELSPRSEARGQQRGVDQFFRSLAVEVGHQAIGVILSGTGSDGTQGLQEIKAEGGITFAQDESAQQDSMPRSAVASGCVDFVLPPEGIAQELARISRHPLVAPAAAPPVSEVAQTEVGQVLEGLLDGTGVDFRNYKRSTLYRRIARRLVLHKLPGLADYLRLLRDDPGEIEALYRDMLIGVTSFFRNPEAFEFIRSSLFPAITEGRSRHDPVRLWVMGCSTGEEAYSLAIAYTEFAEATRRAVPVQIFATDLNAAGIEQARSGIYARSALQDLSPERLRRFFAEEVGGAYRVSKDLRELCVFARHNVLTEPPFSHIDLVSCRNLLIYLDAAAQARVMALLHYALRPGGFLWLGASESAMSHQELFRSENDKFKVFVRKPGPARLSRLTLPHPAGRRPTPLTVEAAPHRLAVRDPQAEADRLLLARYAPAAVLVTHDLDIVQFRGDTSPYLAPASGRATLQLLRMLREGLVVAVRGAIERARREETPVREEGVRVRSNGGYRDVNVEVIPVEPGSSGHGAFLVLFEEVGTPTERRGLAARKKRRVKPAPQESAERERARLRQELAATREYLQSVIEQQESSNEELVVANEEVQSSNEELQSINEELQTSKEEIQSSNEELSTLNDELQERNLELSRSNNDFLNLLSSTQLAIVMLGPDLRIRRFTPAAEKLMNLIPGDVGRPVGDLRLPIDLPRLEALVAEVVDSSSARELEVQDRQGRWYLLKVRPYRTQDNKVDGAVLVLVDVDALKRDQETLRRQNDLLEQADEPILTWQLDGGITHWNRAATELYGFERHEAIGRPSHELLKASLPAHTFRHALARDGYWTGEITYTRSDGRAVEVESRMSLVRDGAGPPVVIETNWPIGERKRMEHTLRNQADALLAADRNRNEFILTLAHELRSPLTALRNAAAILGMPDAGIGAMERARDLMRHQIQNMARLIDDLTDVSSIVRGEYRFRPAPSDVVAVLRRAVEAVRPEAEARRLRLSAELPATPVPMQGDPIRLEQMFTNLLNNAVKFTDEGGKVAMKSELVSEDDRTDFVVTLRDNGIGIPPTVLPRVFDLFTQAEPATRRAPGGLGIGLTLVRRIAEMHGGSVEAFSAGEGQGSEFTIRLPVPRSTP